jgi:maltooligosyltrehalose trehalohydrolase
MAQFRSCAVAEVQRALPDPAAAQSFERAKLDWSEPTREGPHRRALELHRDLIGLRRGDPVLQCQGRTGCETDGAVLNDRCLALRTWTADDERLLIANFGRDLHFAPAPEPLLAPPLGCRWELVFSSEDPRYGGGGTPEVETENDGWLIPGQAALLLKPVPRAAS